MPTFLNRRTKQFYQGFIKTVFRTENPAMVSGDQCSNWFPKHVEHSAVVEFYLSLPLGSRSSALSWALCPISFGSVVFKLGAKTCDGV